MQEAAPSTVLAGALVAPGSHPPARQPADPRRRAAAFSRPVHQSVAHAVAVGLRVLVSPDVGLVGSLLAARAAGAALLAAHPQGRDGDPVPARVTRRFWQEWDTLAPLVHRAELFNGADVYSWVAGASVPGVATGDVHAAEHIRSWETLVPCAKDEEELVAHLRSERPACLVPYRWAPTAEPAAAA